MTTTTAVRPAPNDRYKWIALSNTTLGILMVTINQSILLISLPDVFRGIGMNPLAPGNTSYFLWVLMGFMLVTAVLVVSFGRVGDMYGRVRMYNLGFAVFTVFSVLLSITWMTGADGALWIIFMRVGQGIGASFLFANSGAILTDAFPEDERGKAMGINGVALVSGSFVGLILGGVLAPIEWRLVFLVSVPFGLFGTVWAYLKLRDNGVRIPAKIDWLGNITFAVGLIALLTGIVYGIQPYGGHTMGWTNPKVLGGVIGGVILLVLFVLIEFRVPNPMIRLTLFRIRAFTTSVLAGFLSAIGRGGIQFMLIIWLQGIWLPQHGYSFSQTPLWAGIALVPLTIGFMISGPLFGSLADRLGRTRRGHHRPHRCGCVVPPPRDAADELLLPDVRALGVPAVLLPRHVLHAEPDGRHEQPPARPTRRRRRHQRHLHELGWRALHRHLLHHRDPGVGLGAARLTSITG